MRKAVLVVLLLIVQVNLLPCHAVEAGLYRLLSISISEKLILVSHIPTKAKYLLDASAAKITVGGKPAELGQLQSFSVVQIKLERKKISRKGVDLDGKAHEITVSPPSKSKYMNFHPISTASPFVTII